MLTLFAIGLSPRFTGVSTKLPFVNYPLRGPNPQKTLTLELVRVLFEFFEFNPFLSHKYPHLELVLNLGRYPN